MYKAITGQLDAQPSFVYSSITGTGIQTTRLLELAPANPGDPVVRVALHVVRLDEAPIYDAISYVWGEPGSQRAEIICNGTPFSVTANLYWALRRARRQDAHSLLWADAICINQQDLGERSEQVSFMGKIYRQARMVLICMGEPPDEGGGENVVWLLREAATRGVGVMADDDGPRPVLGVGDPLTVARQWWSVSRLLHQPWFRRSWVLQEAGLARKPVVLYGEVQFEYRALVAVLNWARGQKWSAKFEIPVLQIHAGWLDWSDEGWCRRNQLGVADPTLFDLLDHAALLSCTNPLDHVYAFLGHPVAQKADKSGPMIWPDYTKDVLQVYREVMELLLAIVGGRALVTVEHTDETMADEAVPSWVNRWYIHEVINNISKLPVQTYRAGGLAGWGRPPRVNGPYLLVDGIAVDVVMRCFWIKMLPAPLCRLVFVERLHGSERVFSMEEVAEYISNAELSPSRYGNNRVERETRLVRVLCALPIDERVATNRAYLSDFQQYLNLERHLRAVGNVQSLAAGDPRVEAALAVWQHMSSICQGRGLMITQTGFLGLGPRIARPGDKIYALHGLDVPFIVRPGTRGQRLVGESYVDGLMAGEAFEMLRRGESFEENLSIC